MKTDARTSYHATVLIHILVNIAIGDVKGIYEQAIINGESTFPPDIAVITMKNAITNKTLLALPK